MLVILRLNKKLLEFIRTHHRKDLKECVFEKYGIYPDSTVTFEDNTSP